MYCCACGKVQPENAKFCPFCGNQNHTIVEEANAESRQELPSTADIEIFFPKGDLDPLYIYEQTNWTVRYNSRESQPPAWMAKPIDLMVSEDFIFLISADDEIVKNWKNAAAVATIGAGALVLGLPGILAGYAIGSLVSPKNKHPGFGRNNQLTKNSLLTNIAHGSCLWIEKSKARLKAYNYRSSFMIGFDVYHSFSIAGDFHCTDKLVPVAIYKNFGYNGRLGAYGSDFKKDLTREGHCTLNDEIKVKSDDEAINRIGKFTLE